MNQTDANKVLGRLDVTASEQEFEAGKPGLISILIKNPFDLPIEILELVGPRSPQLQDQDGTPEASREFYRSSWNNFLMWLGLLSPIALENVNLAFAHPKGEAIEKVEPHCDTVMYVSVSTRNWVLFKPTVMKLTPRLKYRVDGVEKTQVVSASISVKPPIKSIVIGAILGAILGFLAKSLQSGTLGWPETLIATGSSAAMSVIATIALSRKTGAQGFITVEDFYGGFAVGALIGYSGSQYFEKVLELGS